MKINSFRCDLADISAKKESLTATDVIVSALHQTQVLVPQIKQIGNYRNSAGL